MRAQLQHRRRTVCERQPGMTMRSRRETITFKHPFRIKGIDRLLPAGAYEVITDEEMIEGLSFAVFRRVATMIMVPAAAPRNSTMEMVSISPIDLSDAQRIDASALVSDKPFDLDKHRGMAEQKATDIRRILADVENNAKDLRDRQGVLENQLLSVPAASWPEAAAKARYVLNFYAAGLAPADTHHRDLVADFVRLSNES